MADGKTTISELSQLNSITDTDLLIVSHLSGQEYVTRSLSAGHFASKQFIESQHFATSSDISAYVTSSDVSAQISATLGNINAILEAINTGGTQVDAMLDQLNGLGE